MNEMQKAYKEGRLAFYSLMKRNDNPYDYDELLAQEWYKGWSDADNNNYEMEMNFLLSGPFIGR